ncbi:hypothetical protein BESB_037930 [Besnoitia besnoiti]|uniref:Uncharacterized protein n=1 Tax=Besnoitia besnoiti TaxID=94643 RepID=A0A2A9MH95_BESBE|nr:hypothetical protein BESB_037930 [Besnoitia besnoiti]PFH37335.1 hypothetical protein BESB_037930 [Besnoitia besnoiti]
MCPPSVTKPVSSFCESAVVASGEVAMLSSASEVPLAGKSLAVSSPSALPRIAVQNGSFGQHDELDAEARPLPPSPPPSLMSSLSPEMASSLRTSRASPGSAQDSEMRVELEDNSKSGGSCAGPTPEAEFHGAISCESHSPSTPVPTTGGEEEGESEGTCSDLDDAEGDSFSTCCVPADRDMALHHAMRLAAVQGAEGLVAAKGHRQWAFYEADAQWVVRASGGASHPQSVSGDRDSCGEEDAESMDSSSGRCFASSLRMNDAAEAPRHQLRAKATRRASHASHQGLLILEREEHEPYCCQDPTDDAEDSPQGCALCRGESDCIGESCCGFVRPRPEGDDAAERESSLDESATRPVCLQSEEDEDEGEIPPSEPGTPRGCPLCRADVDFGGGLGDNCCGWRAKGLSMELHAEEDTTMNKLWTSLEHLRSQESCMSRQSDAYQDEEEGTALASTTSYESPRCFPSMPSEEFFSHQETVFIFDWDDTLLPSSWISQRGLTLESPESEVSLWRMKLAQTAMWAEQTLFTARTLGQVIIVTNAESGWIDLSCSKFLPGLREMLSCFPIVSARSMYESAWCNTPFMWKEAAFMHELQRHFRMESKRWNVISVGDSTHEREALLAVCGRLRKMYHVTTKSLKLLEAPAVEELHSQHELMSKCLAAVARHKGNLDLCVTNAAEPEIDPAAIKLPPALQGRAVGVHRIRHHPLSQELLGRA